MAKRVNGIGWYSDDAVAFPGMLANTSLDIANTYRVEEATGLEPGDAVVLGTDKDNQVKKATVSDVSKIIGVVLHVHKEPSTPYFEQHKDVSVLTFGDVYVELGSDVEAGDPVGINGEGKFVKATDTGIVGFSYFKGGKSGDVAVLRIRK